MNEFIEIGPRFIARSIIQQVLLFEDGGAHVCLNDGSWILVSNADKELVRNQLNPPQPRYPQAVYLTNKETT